MPEPVVGTVVPAVNPQIPGDPNAPKPEATPAPGEKLGEKVPFDKDKHMVPLSRVDEVTAKQREAEAALAEAEVRNEVLQEQLEKQQEEQNRKANVSDDEFYNRYAEEGDDYEGKLTPARLRKIDKMVEARMSPALRVLHEQNAALQAEINMTRFSQLPGVKDDFHEYEPQIRKELKKLAPEERANPKTIETLFDWAVGNASRTSKKGGSQAAAKIVSTKGEVAPHVETGTPGTKEGDTTPTEAEKIEAAKRNISVEALQRLNKRRKERNKKK